MCPCPLQESVHFLFPAAETKSNKKSRHGTAMRPDEFRLEFLLIGDRRAPSVIEPDLSWVFTGLRLLYLHTSSLLLINIGMPQYSKHDRHKIRMHTAQETEYSQ